MDSDEARRWLPTAIVFVIIGFLGSLPRLLDRVGEPGFTKIKAFSLLAGCELSATLCMLVANEVQFIHERFGLLVVTGIMGAMGGAPFIYRLIEIAERAFGPYILRLVGLPSPPSDEDEV